MSFSNSFMLFAGTSHRELAEQIAKNLEVELGKTLIETFPDGEIGISILESVRGKDVFVVQSMAPHPNSYLMELLIFVDALKRSSARSIIAVIPYFGYARQDRRGMGREPITAKLVADLLQRSGVTRILTMDLHTEQIQGFFDIPVDNLYARPVLVEAVRKLQPNQVVTPDVGSIKLACAFAEKLNIDFAVIDKRRVNANEVESALIGDVYQKRVLLVDDMCSTGGTLKKAALVCKKAGASAVFAAVTHGLFIEKFENSGIEKIIMSNTVPTSNYDVEVVSVAPLFAEAIRSIVDAKSISSLFTRF
ncbi:ribose-phosphate pyrophosphokinase [Candidatus Rhabdochlamydia sp. T3358]|uniref:ribose-phosphate diphosphokinase n=1 Tax=Candidatus Rhabdochlamydia sp. T3358 TaxID=2099795 RepID=UPI0010B11760|nr:ribose-phosphate pyrophosphokinase [Candidatus Rhabdochlamydia sp. T3358]VHO03770.1 Ribose-phosphate pyrophosphokinase [Candidatus Rhabdochlamydia sp. T3358]